MRSGREWAGKAECCHVTGTRSEVSSGDRILNGNSVPKLTRVVIYLLKIPDSGIEAQKLHQPALFWFYFSGTNKRSSISNFLRRKSIFLPPPFFFAQSPQNLA